MSRSELDNLFEEATILIPELAKPIDTRHFTPIKVTSRSLDEVLNYRLIGFFPKIVEQQRQKTLAMRIDGRIIGTGAEDFTKGNMPYILNYEGKRFQLIDVPGIEGEEKKYTHLIRQAVAKAHLVFYVNGTNKKPETDTAKKIRSYLRLGAQVCPLINVRGNGDAYEDEEDRQTLASHGNSAEALRQTVGVLESVLDPKVMLQGHCVQGLLAFSSLAINSGTGLSTIHPSREKDLIIQQRSCRKRFPSSRAMYEFSQIQSVASVLHGKLGTFKEDMIESNKIKVQKLLGENLKNLQELYANHKKFLAKTDPEFNKCRDAIKGSWETFERIVTNNQKNTYEKLFTELEDSANTVIAKSFDAGAQIIQNEIERELHDLQEQLKEDLNTQFTEHVKILQVNLREAMQRLLEDVSRVEFEQALIFADGDLNIALKSSTFSLGLDLGDYGWMAVNIASYAWVGASIGSSFPVVGTIIGAILGAVLGVGMEFLKNFFGKDKRIREAQTKFQQKITEARKQSLDSRREALKSLLAPVRTQIDAVFAQIDDIYASLSSPLDAIKQLEESMSSSQALLKKMPYGTINV